MRNQGTILAVAISFLVIAFVFLYVSQSYIPNQTRIISEKLSSQYTTCGVFVVTGEDGIPAGTIITDDYFNQGTIDIQNIPYEFVPKKQSQLLVYTTGGSVTDSTKEAYRSLIIGKTVKNDIETGSIISYASLGEGDEVIIDSFSKQIQLSVENTVGNNLKTGKYVDIIVKYQNGGYDIVASKIIVDSVITTGISDEDITESTNAIILISVDDTEYRDIELAKRLGEISIRLYKSADQYASAVTFNYNSKIKEVNEMIDALALTGEHTSYYTEYSMKLDNDKSSLVDDSEVFVYMQWYSELYFKIEKLLKYKSTKNVPVPVPVVAENEDTDENGNFNSLDQTAEQNLIETEELKKVICENDANAERYKLVNGSSARETITIAEIVKETDTTELDVLIALILGNETIYSSNNRIELFNNYISNDKKTSMDIRKDVTKRIANVTLDYYTAHAGEKTNNVAYLIINGYVKSVSDLKNTVKSVAAPKVAN